MLFLNSNLQNSQENMFKAEQIDMKIDVFSRLGYLNLLLL